MFETSRTSVWKAHGRVFRSITSYYPVAPQLQYVCSAFNRDELVHRLGKTPDEAEQAARRAVDERYGEREK